MNKNVNLIKLAKIYSINDIEKHLVYNFLKIKGLNFNNNKFLSAYFDNYEFILDLTKEIHILNHITIEELLIDMELLIPNQDKKLNGAFFTPSYIVNFIINTIRPKENETVIDISCGSGAFLIGLVKYFTTQYNKSIVDCIKENIYGADILDYNVLRCKLLLILYGLEHSENIEEKDINVIQCDSLKHNWSQKYDAIVGNPPYVKFQDLCDNTRNYLLEKWETTKNGTFNLYFAFFELGLKLLKKNGRLGYITPNNYFTSLSGECLRRFFQKEKCIYKIVDFYSTKIFDVQTYTAITFINKEDNEYIQYSRIKPKEEPKTYLKDIKYTKNQYSILNQKKWRLLCGDERNNITIIENAGMPLGKLFNICVGIATLKDSIFCFNPIKEDKDYYYIEANNNVYNIEKQITREVIKISEIKTQLNILSNKRRIIFPYIIIKNKPIIIKEDDMKLNYPGCYQYLISNKEILETRDKGKNQYKPFYSYGRTQGLNRIGIKLLTPTFSKVPRFLLDNNDQSLFTNGYGIYLPVDNSQLLYSSLINRFENIDVLQKILNSLIMKYYITKTSVSIDGGYPCYQKNFIEKFSIPNLTEKDIVKLRQLKKEDEINNYLIKLYHIQSLNLEE